MSEQSKQQSIQDKLDELENFADWLQAIGQIITAMASSKRLQLKKNNRINNQKINQIEDQIKKLHTQLQELKNHNNNNSFQS